MHLWLATFALTLLAIYFSLRFIDLYHPSFATTGTLGAAILLIYTTLSKWFSRIWGFFQPQIGTLVRVFDNNRFLTMIVSLIIVLIIFFEGITMLSGYFDRYRYANMVREIVAAQTSDVTALPDPSKLIESYKRLPERKEIPILITRTGRIFSIGGSWNKFIEYQKSFADEVYEFAISNPNFCRLKSDFYDPISFVAISYLESSVVLLDGKPQGTESFIERATRALDLLNSCLSSSNIQALTIRQIYSLRIRYILSVYGAIDYDIGSELELLEEKFDDLDVLVLSDLYRSHAYQEYLDFRIVWRVRQLASNAKTKHQKNATSNSSTDHRLVITELRKLLRLRQSLNKNASVRWINTPGKLDTYRYFMVFSGYLDASSSEIHRLLVDLPSLSESIAKVVNANAFKEFQSPDNWSISTPLDPSLEGDTLVEYFNNSLKER